MRTERVFWIIRMRSGSEPLRLNFNFGHALYRDEVVVSRAGRAAVFGSRAMACFDSESAAQAECDRLSNKKPGLCFEVDSVTEWVKS